jgi:hypothetical protein
VTPKSISLKYAPVLLFNFSEVPKLVKALLNLTQGSYMCVSLNSRLDSNREEEKRVEGARTSLPRRVG